MTWECWSGHWLLALSCGFALAGCADPATTPITGDGDGDGDWTGDGDPGQWPLPDPSEDPYEGVDDMNEVIDPAYGCRSTPMQLASQADLRMTAHPGGQLTVWDRSGAVDPFQLDELGARDSSFGTLGTLDSSAFALSLTDFVGIDGGRLLVGGSVDIEGLALDGVCLLDSNGKPDPTFGGDGGCVQVAQTVGSDVRVAALEDGVLVFVGMDRIAKLDWAGVPLDVYGDAGLLDGWTAGLGLPVGSELVDVVATADASYVLLGYDEPRLDAPRVVRITADGSGADPDFVAAQDGLLAGLAPLDEDLLDDRSTALAVAPDGTLAVAGAFLPELGDGWSWVARLESSGTPVATFGTGGVALRQAGTWDITVGPAYVEHLALAFDGLGELWSGGRWWLDMPGLVRWTAGGAPGSEWFLHDPFLPAQHGLWPTHDVVVNGDDVFYLGTAEQAEEKNVYVCRVNLDP